MKFATVLISVALLGGGCSTHSIDPQKNYDDPDEVPRVENVTVIPGVGSSFDVNWDYEDSIFEVVDGFYVERAPFAVGTPVGTYQRLNQELIQRREYEDRSTLPEGLYAYRVISATAAGVLSKPSGVAIGEVDLTPPSPPTLSAEVFVSLGRQLVALTWTSPEEGVVFYRLYRDPGFGLLPFIPIPRQDFQDGEVGPDPLTQKPQVYHYWVTALDGGFNESVHSNIEAVQIEF